ncbi:MAG: apolipoprotein N-acyltransferase [bacterium]
MTQLSGIRFQVLRAAAAIISGLLLASSFAPLEWADTAWLALIPLIIALRFVSPRDGFRLGLLAGGVFWLTSISWLHHVSIPGWILLALYCGLYIGVFAWGCGHWLNRFGAAGFLANAGFIVFASTLWTALEYVRSHVGTGFPWNGLGISQYRNMAIIQIASLGGSYAVSFLIVWISAAVGITILRYVDTWGRWGRRLHLEMIMGFLVLAFAFAWGVKTIRSTVEAGTPVRISLIQPGIPQDEKWDQAKIDLIYARLRELTTAALRTGKPDLLVWPETAVPDDVRTSASSYDLVYEIVTNGTPLLVGSMDTAWQDTGHPVYYNSSFLFDREGAIMFAYDKQHLVPFGEYVPMRHIFPFMKAMTPIQESFNEGRTGTVFRLASPEAAFSVLICFEDTVAHLARQMVRNGARMLVNQTNDAWFDPSAASRQHMAHGVFRCVENGVPAVRSANSGVTCHIDRRGRIVDILDDGAGHTPTHGFSTVEVAVPGADMPLTWYTRHGDMFAWGCAGVAGVMLALVRKRQTLNSKRLAFGV